MKRRSSKKRLQGLRDLHNVRQTKSGTFYIVDNSGTNIFEEYFLSNTNTEEEAWTQAKLTWNTTQHFNRTHPEKMTYEHNEIKKYRIGSRVKQKNKEK